MRAWRGAAKGSGQGAAVRWPALIVVGLLVMAALPASPVRAQMAPPEGFADLVERVGPAVVNIQTQRQADEQAEDMPMPQFPPGSPFEEFFREFFDRENQPRAPRRTASLGSGFVVDPSGYVVTNNHVIAEADEINVVFNDDSEYVAEVVGHDPKTDLALLKIERDEPFPAVEWADSDNVRVGDWMVAIGNPFGLGFSVTAGIISARGRDIRAGPYDDFFQVDAAINRGNSGGPSFTLDGKVFGVNTAIFSPSGGNVGIGFAIPSNLARNVIESIKETGRVARGWLGVRIQTVTPEIAESLGLEEAAGALVASVTPGGPAEDADIQAGDVIVEFDGRDIDEMRSLPRIVAETEIGREVEVGLWRRGERREVTVVLGELPDDETLAALAEEGEGGAESARSTAEIPEAGLVIAALDEETREEYDVPAETEGVVIVEVMNGGAAADAGLRPGDVIVEIGQDSVASPPEVMARVNQALEEGKQSILLLIDRQDDLRFVALRLDN